MRTGRLGILLFLALGCTVSGDDALHLRLNLVPGQSFGLKMVVDQKVVQDVRGTRLNLTSRMGMGYTFAVESIDTDGNAWVKSTYEWVSVKQETPMGRLEYDSADPPEAIPLAARGIAAMVGGSFSMLLNPQGTILEVKGLDSLLERMLKEIDDPQEPSFKGIEKQVKDQFGGDALKQMMRYMLAHFPDGPVQVGDSWDQKVVISQGFPMIIETTYTLRERKDGVATIDNKSTIRTNPDGASPEGGAVRMRHELTGTQEGYTKVDEATGTTLGGEATQSFQIRGEDQGEPMSVLSTVTIGPLEK